MNSTKNMFIISFDSSIALVALEGNNVFLYERLVTDNNIDLEVQEIDPHTAKCIIYGNSGLLKPNMSVSRTREYMTIKFNQSYIGKVVSPDMKILSDGIFTSNASESQYEDEYISLMPKKYSINEIDTSKSIMYTGIKVIDFFTPLTYGSKIGIMGGAGVGKAQPLRSTLYNYNGPMLMKNIKAGDEILGSNGFVKVKGVYPQGIKTVYKIVFEDDRVVECCENHLWPVYDYAEGIRVLELQDIIELSKKQDVYTILEHCKFNNKSDIKISDLVIYALYLIDLVLIDDKILVSKYTQHGIINLILKDYKLSEYNDDYMELAADKEIVGEIINRIQFKQFLYCESVYRVSLVASICNIDPEEIYNGKKIIYSLNCIKIQDQLDEFIQYVRSIGGFVILNGEDCEVNLNAICIKIKKIISVSSEEVQCISVDAKDGIYITDEFIPTHNTTLMLEIIKNISTDKLFKIFCGVGERIREGLEMYKDFVSSGIIDVNNPNASDTLLIYGNMDQSAAIRQLAGRVGVAMTRYMMDVQKKDVMIIIDNIFRYNQASCEIGTSLNQFQTERGYHPNIRSMMSRLQENMIALNNGTSATSIQAIYVPADDNTDIGALTCQEHQSVSILLSRDLAKQKIYPAVDLLASWSINMQESIVGKNHLAAYKKTIVILDKYNKLLDLINIVGIENLSYEDQLTVKRATLIQAYMTQPLAVTQQFMSMESCLVDIEDIIFDINNIIDGHYDEFNASGLKFKGTIKDLKHLIHE